ncbi:MAG: Fe-S cluster assembly protein SufD [Sphingobacteriia bacterium]|nr:Fe-S cluster assembly protein SufD [Sphingobacteriia bacterium]NCC39695.1 Fe-S cluster assembly protein SufD [Gammaproteobacteria bacterium]
MTGASAASFDNWVPARAADLPGAALDWLESQRHQALARVRAHGIPSSKEEAWRYTSLKGLLEQGFSAAAERPPLPTLEALHPLLVPGLDSHRVVLVNGCYIPELSALGPLPLGVRIGGLRSLLASEPDALRDRLNGIAEGHQSFFAALNTAGLDDGLVVMMEPDTRLDRPLELIHLAVGMDAPRVAQPRHWVALDEGAQARLIERYVSLDQSLYCTNSVLEIALGRDALLEHDRIQSESPNAFHIAGLYLHQETGSRYHGVNIGLGGRWARTEIYARLAGMHAECDLQGLYLAGDRQLMDYHLDVDHAVPACVSREGFKGILYGKGRAVFDGRVVVAKEAQKSDAAMSNHNLMLSESAEIDTKPQLEINADDVKCSHGTTVGQLEPEMLFYLRSRGIAAPAARRMLCLGFAEEVIASLHAESVREQISEQVGQRLETAPID